MSYVRNPEDEYHFVHQIDDLAVGIGKNYRPLVLRNHKIHGCVGPRGFQPLEEPVRLRSVFALLLRPELQITVADDWQIRHIGHVVQPILDMLVDERAIHAYASREHVFNRVLTRGACKMLIRH